MGEKPECSICLREYLPIPAHRPAASLCGHFLHHSCLEELLANEDKSDPETVTEELATRTEEPEVSLPTTNHIAPVLPPVPHPEASFSYAQSASPPTYGRSPEPVEPSPTNLTGHQPPNLRLGVVDVPSHSFPTPQNVTAFGPVLLDVGQENNSTPLVMQASTVVVDKAGTLSLDEVNRRLRSEFPEALVSSQDRRTLARFLAEIMKKAFPECKKVE
ncbi:hypothetical protein RvY_02818 [Ramazzottius varieornatus]|uniref:RING-type domain-containing protein n=1 Tax=Ramazzottius varieornatus TaxID=947166 RepID=A0A1D1UW64_RAMVA|nr:hypothetical protein RvY_02818 [Ramazzottius varieornatus]